MESIKINNSNGYFWKSDKDAPDVFVNEDVNVDFNDIENPFIVEGMLANNEVSYSIKYVDGKYRIKKFVFSEMSKIFDEKIYLSNRIDGKRLVLDRKSVV